MKTPKSEKGKTPRRKKDGPKRGFLEEEREFFFQAINRWGETIQCEELFAFSSNGRDYMVYTDNTHTFWGRLNIYATLYNPETFHKGRPLFLRDPETEEEWRLIQRTAEEMMDLI